MSPYTPLEGYWLYDAGLPFSDIFFNIARPDNFPPELDIRKNRVTCDAVSKLNNACLFHNNLSSLKVGITSGYGYRIPNSATEILAELHRLIAVIRREVAIKHNLRKSMAFHSTGQSAFDYQSWDYLSESQARIRLGYLQAAKEVVFGINTIESVTEKMKTIPENVRVWISIYLSSGPNGFMAQDNPFTPEFKKQIARDHFYNDHSLEFTATKYYIYKLNPLKRLLHHYNPF